MAEGLRGVVFDLFGTLITTTADDVIDDRRLLAEDLGVDADAYTRVRHAERERAETGGTGGPAETLAFFARQPGVQPRPGALRRPPIIRPSKPPLPAFMIAATTTIPAASALSPI